MVIAGGLRIPRFTVFCPYRKTSTDLRTCVRCARLEEFPAVPRADDAVVVCGDRASNSRADADSDSMVSTQSESTSSPMKSPEASMESIGALAVRYPAAAALPRVAMCAREGISIDEAFSDERVVAIPVVDADRRYVGMAWRPGLTRPQWIPADWVVGAPVIAAAVESGNADVRSVAERCWPAVRETAALSEALELMALRHARVIAVVDADRRLVGTLTDRDLLAWLEQVNADCSYP